MKARSIKFNKNDREHLQIIFSMNILINEKIN